MTKLTGKIIELRNSTESVSELALGDRLRALREVAGLSRVELSDRLGITRQTLLALESESDLAIPVLKQYVEALGATLQINAAFPGDNPVSLRVFNALDHDTLDDNQLILPIVGDEEFRPRRDVVLSIKPQYSEKILLGQKTVELRRRFPVSVPPGTIAYIYSTTPDKALVGCAEIEEVVKKPIEQVWKQHRREACISKDEFDSYFSGQDHGFALRLGQAIPFSKPISLEELRERFGFEPPQSFLYAKPLFREALRNEFTELPN